MLIILAVTGKLLLKSKNYLNILLFFAKYCFLPILKLFIEHPARTTIASEVISIWKAKLRNDLSVLVRQKILNFETKWLNNHDDTTLS